MRIVPAIIAVPLLVILLTWMSLRTFNHEAEQSDWALAKVDRSSMLEATLQRDVLSTRAGLLQNYDPLVRDADALRASVDEFRAIAAADPRLRTATEAVAAATAREEGLVEQFKSDNALLKNSLSYLATFSSRPAALGGGADPGVVNGLVAAMLRLTLDTSPASTQDVKRWLERVAALPPGRVPEGVLAHGRLLEELLPKTDDGLVRLLAAAPRAARAELRTRLLAQQSASRSVARQYRTALYVTSLFLVMLLAYLAWQLRRRAHAARRRVAFERVVASSSLRCVGARREDLADAVVQTIADMARCVGAQRAYLLSSAPDFADVTWCDEGMAFPWGWPARAPRLLERFAHPAPGGSVHVPSVRRVRSPSDRQALEAEGLRGWACIWREDEQGNRLLLGFDAVTRDCSISPGGELGLLPMGLDVVANALARQSLEHAHERLQARLQQSRQLETVGALTSGIAHNFNNVLGAILGYAEMASERSTGSAQQRVLLQEIRSAGHRARELVDQILDSVRRRERQKRPVRMSALIDESVSLLRALIPGSVSLDVTDLCDAAVLGEPAQLQQVILNLVSNAAQATGLDGRVELLVDTVDLPASRAVSHGTLGPGAYVRIAVTDNGGGIEAATLAQIFEPFFTTRRDGNGLGLATCQEIVTEHDGAIHVQSTLGKGTRFEVWLPQLRSPVAAASSVQTVPTGGGETILVVEEDPDRLLRDEEVLAALGFEPVGFLRADAARDACRADPDRFDAAVLGHLGAASAAPRLAASLRRMAPTLPILLGTISADRLDAGDLAAAGVSDVVRWPFAAAELLDALNEGLRRAAAATSNRTASFDRIDRPLHRNARA